MSKQESSAGQFEISLVHTGENIPLTLLLALWHEMTLEWLPAEIAPMRLAMPLLNSAVSLHVLLERRTVMPRGAAYSLDVACRIASRRCDTMQTTSQFFAANERWLRKLERSPSLRVNHAALTDESQSVWEQLTPAEREAAIGAARRVLEADIESGADICAVVPPAPQPPVERPSIAAEDDLAAALVAQIHAQPFQAHYRRKPHGPAQQGWPARLQGYFWPMPSQGYRQVSAALADLLTDAEALARALAHAPWGHAQQQQAVALALRIFEWGGVAQDPATVTAENVMHVFGDALANNARSTAPMNSGWTKVAAFATAHLEADGLPQVIWDSRVATALIGRLDTLLPASRLPSDAALCIGTVPGRGGTRPRPLARKWPAGYQRWDTQVAGSMLVRRMRDVLNDPTRAYPDMPLPAGGSGAWTTRGVEMVLFMDGY